MLCHTRDYIVTGGEDGFVRFFDFQMRIVAWFEDLDSGPITSISFANKVIPRYEDNTGMRCEDDI